MAKNPPNREEDQAHDAARRLAGLHGCGHRPQAEPHTCPFQREVKRNNELFCTCCDECTGSCANDARNTVEL